MSATGYSYDSSATVNHGKKWCSKTDEKILRDFVKNNDIITTQMVTELSMKLKRTDYAIKVRMMRTYVVPSYDYVNYENEALYAKYICYGDKDCIDRLVFLDKWSYNDELALKNFVDSNDIITYQLVSEIAAKIKRTHYAVKIRLMKKYIIPNYDYFTNNNDDLYNKYVCYDKEEIDNVAFFDYRRA